MTATKTATKARVREVYPPRQLVHQWAHRTQQYGRNAGRSMYFEGDTIYSYGRHFAIARHVSHKGKRAVLFNRTTYSTTTAKHCSYVRNAIPSSLPVIYVLNPAGTFDDNRADFADRIKRAEERLAGSRRGVSRVKRYRELCDVIRAANLFLDFYDSACYGVPHDNDLEALCADLAAKSAARAKREAARRKREIEAAAAKLKHEMADSETLWRSGNNRHLPHLYRMPVMLRLSEDGTQVQTSHGAEFPLAHGLRALPLLQSSCKSYFSHLTAPIRLGHFQIDAIEPNGDIVAGCHRVTWAEVQRLLAEVEARQLAAN